MRRRLSKTAFLLVVGLAAPVAVMAAAPMYSGSGLGRHNGQGFNQRSDSLQQRAPYNQAGQLLQRLGYGPALHGGLQASDQFGLQRQPEVSQAAKLQAELRGGSGLGQSLETPSLPSGLVPATPGLASPPGLSSNNPTANFQDIPDQNSPYTSSGNAAGKRVYHLPSDLQ